MLLKDAVNQLTQLRKVPSTIGVTVVIPMSIRAKHSVIIGGVLIPTGGAGVLEGALLEEIMELVEAGLVVLMVQLSGFLFHSSGLALGKEGLGVVH